MTENRQNPGIARPAAEAGGEEAVSFPAAVDKRKAAVEAAAERRKTRAAEKLRENLLRRKQQSRARRAGQADETDGLPAANSSQPDD